MGFFSTGVGSNKKEDRYSYNAKPASDNPYLKSTKTAPKSIASLLGGSASKSSITRNSVLNLSQN